MDKEENLGMLIGMAISGAFESLNESDSNFERANVVDGLFFIGRAIEKLAEAVKATVAE